MRKFFVDKSQVNMEKKTISIIGNDVNHIKNVLKNKANDELDISINEGDCFLCRIKNFEADSIVCDIIEKSLKNTEPKNRITLFQGLPKADKMEYIIEKCTEIGIAEFTPVMMHRSIVKLDEKDKIKKVTRWQKIAETAGKQSKRNIIPKINNIINFKDLIEIFEKYDIILIAYENENKNSIKSALKNIESKPNGLNIGILVGPEGGIEEQEIEMCCNGGCPQPPNIKIVHLGDRILRTETAGLVISTIILYELGDMD